MTIPGLGNCESVSGQRSPPVGGSSMTIPGLGNCEYIPCSEVRPVQDARRFSPPSRLRPEPAGTCVVRSGSAGERKTISVGAV